jgi:alkylation response protein AidB-like acyl-CoA dehydrogenase
MGLSSFGPGKRLWTAGMAVATDLRMVAPITTQSPAEKFGSIQLLPGRAIGRTDWHDDPRQYLRSLLDGLGPDAVSAPVESADRLAAYSRKQIRRDEDCEIAAARWKVGRSCELHGHSESAVLVRVRSGLLVEERYIPTAGGGYQYESSVLRKGSESYLPAGAYHRIWCIEEADTIHGFAPPPENPVTPVPPELQAEFIAAKQRALSSPDAAGKPNRSIIEAILIRLERWAKLEQEQERQGKTTLSTEMLAELRASGILAAPVPEHLGGWGATLAETAQAIRLLATRAPATALALAMPLGNAAATRIPDECVAESLHADLADGRRWIAGQVLAGRILAVANSEPGAGGDLAQTQTTATLGSDGQYRLTGRKSFATIGPDADYFLCAAKRNSGENDSKQIVDGFFVARDALGLSLDGTWNALGMRTTASIGLTLRDTPAAALLGYPGCLEGINARHWSTVLFAAVFVGIGEGAIAAAVQEIGAGAKSCYVRASLAECQLNVDAATGFLEAVASNEQWPASSATRERIIRAKTFAAKSAVEAAMRCAMLCGGRSYRPDHPVYRTLHDALAGPLLRPPLPKAMDNIAAHLFGV